MPHVDHDDGNVAMAFRQQADLPRERERRMAAMDEDRLAVVARDLHDGIDHRRIRREGVEKRLHLDAGEMEIAQVVFQIVVGWLAQIGVYPIKRNYRVGHLVEHLQQLRVQMGGGWTENRLFYIVFRHLRGKHFRVEIDIEGGAEHSDVGMGVYFPERCKWIDHII